MLKLGKNKHFNRKMSEMDFYLKFAFRALIHLSLRNPISIKVTTLDSLIESDADAASVIFSANDRAMAHISSSFSLSLFEGLVVKLKPGARELEGVT